MGILWYIIIFWLQLGIFSQIRFWKIIFLYQKFFLKFLKIFFFALNSFLGWFMAKKIFSKKFQKKFWPKKIGIFFQNLICEKIPSFVKKWWYIIKSPCLEYMKTYRVSNIEVCLLKVIKNIENELVFVNTCAFFQENLGHFHNHALTFQKS